MTFSSEINAKALLTELARRHDSLDKKLFRLQKSVKPDDFEIFKIKKEKLRIKDTLTKIYAQSVPNIIA